MRKISFNSLEIQHISEESLNTEQIFRVKKEWYEALETLENYLIEGNRKIKRITYNSLLFYLGNAPAGINKDIFIFSTPNRAIPFDFFPSAQGKIGNIGHEAFGHLADYQQYHKSWEDFVEECELFTSPEQRANLRVAYALPKAFFEHIKELRRSAFRHQIINPDLGKYEEAFTTIEALGRAGLSRRDNIPDFFKEVNENKGTIDIYLEKIYIFALAGLAVPPNLNHETKYGIMTRDDLKTIKNKVVAKYVKGEIKKIPKVITTNDEYRPEYSVDLRWIAKEKALENLDNAISEWQNKSRRHNGFYCFEDMCESLKIMYNRLEKELKAV